MSDKVSRDCRCHDDDGLSTGVFGPIESPLDLVEETDLEAGLLVVFEDDRGLGAGSEFGGKGEVLMIGRTFNGGCCMAIVGCFLDLKPIAVAKLVKVPVECFGEYDGVDDAELDLLRDHHRVELSALRVDTADITEKERNG